MQDNRLSERGTQAASGVFHYSQSQIGLTASSELDFWGRFRRAVESADDAPLATLANDDNTLVSLTADVVTNYVLIRTAEKRLDIARRHLGDTLATDLSTIAHLLWSDEKVIGGKAIRDQFGVCDDVQALDWPRPDRGHLPRGL